MSAARKVRQTAKKDHDSRGAHCSLARHSALPSTLPKGSGCHFWTYILRDYGSKELKVATKLILMHECIFYNHWVRGGSGENPIFFGDHTFEKTTHEQQHHLPMLICPAGNIKIWRMNQCIVSTTFLEPPPCHQLPRSHPEFPGQRVSNTCEQNGFNYFEFIWFYMRWERLCPTFGLDCSLPFSAWREKQMHGYTEPSPSNVQLLRVLSKRKYLQLLFFSNILDMIWYILII